MKKSSLWAMVIFLFIALALSAVQAATAVPLEIDNLAAVSSAQAGKLWVSIYEKNDIGFYLLGDNGAIQKSFSIPRRSGELQVKITYMAADAQNRLYFIKQYTDASGGGYDTRQELAVYTPKLLPLGRLRSIRLNNRDDAEDIRFLHISISTSLVLTGVSEDGERIHRRAYDIDALNKTGDATIKNSRSYPASSEEGVFKAVASGVDTVFLSQSGKVFLSQEDTPAPVLLFPEAESQYVYASFLCEDTSGQVIVGEQKNGGILRLSTGDGRAEYLWAGGQTFGSLPYTCGEVLEMSFQQGNNASYVAVVQNKDTGASEFVVCEEGNFSLITRLKTGFWGSALTIVGRMILYFLALSLLAGGIVWLRRYIAHCRTIFVKLIIASIPLLVVALGLFGTYSYFSYQSALNGTYQTKVADQGNLLRALFASASFDHITAPALYTSPEYGYLRAQMATRDVYTASAYFVDGRLYTGVDFDVPCLYSFGIRYSVTAQVLYREAALTGRQQIGIITDRFGERIACVTPVGSSSGNTVFLLETGIFTAEIRRQAASFIRNYLTISLLCLLSASALLLILFRRILGPLTQIIGGLEQFSKGNREVRLHSETNDELADIVRVFNKMTKDIDIQLYNLRTMGETYYRFVPQQIFRLLGKDNLADIELGSAVEGRYCILVANLYLRQGYLDFANIQKLTNLYFAIVHQVSNEGGATLLSDSAGLRDLRLIFPSGDAAVAAAIDAIARIDGHNAKSPIYQRLDVSFFLDFTDMGFGICGDGERYVPAMISAELDEVLDCCEEFRRLSSRLIVTEVAYRILEAEKYFHRFIGYAGSGDKRIGLYDFYTSSSPSLIRLLNDTKSTFDKAMELYLQKRYYDAKNLFAIVLRENQYDNVARHYVFKCEKNL